MTKQAKQEVLSAFEFLFNFKEQTMQTHFKSAQENVFIRTMTALTSTAERRRNGHPCPSADDSKKERGLTHMKKNELIKRLEERKDRSAWDRGVTAYAIDLVEDLDDDDINYSPCFYKTLLNGASNWTEYSWGGCSYIYDEDIAKRLCTPTELKKTDNGRRRPNGQEEWLDVQARALYQASNRIIKALRFE